MKDLPYDKTASVAELDAVRPTKTWKRPKQKPSVPASKCALSKGCSLRKAGNCSPLHCSAAAQYVANATSHAAAIDARVDADVGRGD